jgi:hypothetical protein
LISSHEEYSAVFFQSTWCDWYLKDSRPEMSQNCINALQQINQLGQQYPQLKVHGLATRLWTGKDDLEEYKKRVKPLYSLQIDETNEIFFHFKIKQVPTLILLKNGKELTRIEKFSEKKDVLSKINKALLK